MPWISLSVLLGRGQKGVVIRCFNTYLVFFMFFFCVGFGSGFFAVLPLTIVGAGARLQVGAGPGAGFFLREVGGVCMKNGG